MKLPRRPALPSRRAFHGLYESVMRALAKVVTDRRWAAPLSAMALGFGLFLGVAIGPGADGSLATGAAQIIAIASPELAAESGSGGGGGGGGGLALAGEPDEGSLDLEPEPFEPEPLEAEATPEPEAGAEEESPPSQPEPEAEEPEGESVEVKGTVVRANPAAGSYTLAVGGGELVSVHAPKLPAAGAKLEVEATPFANNTFGEEKRTSKGRAAGASFSGVVTYVDPDPAAPAYTVSGRGSSILVHADPTQAAALPALGAYAKVTVGLERAPDALPAPEAPTVPAPEPAPCAADPTLAPPAAPATVMVQRRLEVEAEPATYVDLAGVLSAICPQTGQIAISADDLRESGADLLLTLPANFKTSGLELGDSVLATATLTPEGALTVAGLASDEGTKGAEDARAAQGDLAR